MFRDQFRLFCLLAGVFIVCASLYQLFQTHHLRLLVLQRTSNALPECNGHLKCSRSNKKTQKTCDFHDAKRMEYLVGRWERRKLLKMPYEYQPECNGGSFPCHVISPNQCIEKAKKILEYQWIPSSCYLLPFDPFAFSKSLAGRSMVFVGDSLMRQMFNSLRFLLTTVTKEINRNSEMFRTVDDAEVSFVWSKFLVDEKAFVNNGTLSVHSDLPWLKQLNGKREIKYFIFNTGHHWHKVDRNFVKYSSMVNLVLEALKRHFNGSLLIFRTTSAGHYGCEVQNRAPIDYIPVLKPEIDRYNWRKPIAAEVQWLDKAAEKGMAYRFRFLNVSNSGFRSDAHSEFKIRNGRKSTDCLHWCLPGVPGNNS